MTRNLPADRGTHISCCVDPDNNVHFAVCHKLKYQHETAASTNTRRLHVD